MIWLVFGLMLIVTAGEPVTVLLTGGDGPVDVQVAVEAGEQLTVTARSLADEPLDVTLEILRDEARLAFNDDHDTDFGDLAPLDAAIVAFVPPEAGTVTLRIHSFNGAQTGEIEVSVESSPLVPPCDEPLHSATLRQNSVFTCWLELEAGATLTVAARDSSGTLDPVLRLLDADQALLADNDDHGTADLTLNVLDAKIADYIIVNDGRYTIQVRDFAGAAGMLDLTLTISS